MTISEDQKKIISQLECKIRNLDANLNSIKSYIDPSINGKVASACYTLKQMRSLINELNR